MTLPVAILCGGKATRLGVLTHGTPKSLLDVAGEPFIFHQLRLLHDQGFDEVVLCIGNFGGMIRDAVGDGTRLGMQIKYSFDGYRPLGTGGAVKRAIPVLGHHHFMVMYGDSYLNIPYRPIIDEFIRSGKSLGLMTQHKGVDYGIGIFSEVAFYGRNEPKFDLSLVYESLKYRKLLETYEVPERFYEIGSPEGLEEVRRKLSIAMESTA